ncbi:MarR family winged helix-turn-helix transcriptional regulator [Chthonobacter rhizosphaerae]|uniref:MarR family winged helix-turn-helix transcriptional regulator n=1 Tax=Chthonobacter rhizosphaerae TaxID=2735553 RepID=UPI0015EEB76F|nr:MarR family transcriptional regulator [Chthonobacter rhizosphaerae]
MPLQDEPLGFIVVDVARLFRQRFEAALAEAGLGVTPGEARTLYHVVTYGPVRQSLLAGRLAVEPMTLVGTLDRLERAGLVARMPDPGDRRAKRVTATAAADALYPRIHQVALTVRAEATAGLDPEDVDRLRATLSAMRRNLDGGDGSAPSDEGAGG